MESSARFPIIRMKINKQKRIGEIIIVTEGVHPEFDIIKGIFHEFLGYSVISKRRNGKDVTVFNGHDKNSRVIVVNAPTNNISSIVDTEKFYDFLYHEVALKYDIDLINDSTYIVFDRDRKNNRLGIVRKLIESLTHSQTDSDEQNGLLLLSYPSIEAFKISMIKEDSYKLQFSLGNEVKQYIEAESLLDFPFYESGISHATLEFINYLASENLIESERDLSVNLDTLGAQILNRQTDKFCREQKFDCISQIIEILIDLNIIDLEN